MSRPEQNFILSRELVNSVSKDEMFATFAAMQEADIARDPYSHYHITVPADLVIVCDAEPQKKQFIATQTVKIEYLITLDGKTAVRILVSTRNGFEPFNQFTIGTDDEATFADQQTKVGAYFRVLLMVVLATKNVIKTTTESKLAKLGIGKPRYKFSTTITIGTVTESAAEGAGHGTSVRPHLRRGHIRRQHHGPNNELVKSIFIEPVFVNADEAWIGQRQAYNVKTIGDTVGL